jgi:hypothetical protein
MTETVLLLLQLSIWTGALSEGQCMTVRVDGKESMEMRLEGNLQPGEFRSARAELPVDLFRALRIDARRLMPDPATGFPEFLNLSLQLRESGALVSNCQFSPRLQVGPITPLACSVVSGQSCWGVTLQARVTQALP